MQEDNFSLSVSFPMHRTDIARQISNVFLNIARGTDRGEPLPEDVTGEPGGELDVSGTPNGSSEDWADASNRTPGPVGELGGVLEDLDEKGVARNDEYCAKAKEPYYKSGPRKGQWKKRQGVSDEAYDMWYGIQLQGQPSTALTEGATTGPTEEPPVNVAGAFGGQQQPATEEPATAPQNVGDYMAWLSARQTSGHVPQEMVDLAFKTTGVSTATLFSDPDAVSKLYAFFMQAGVPA